MSPIPVRYKAKSIIYFQGDMEEKIYILKSGRVSLNYNDIETGQLIHDQIQMGEFFGVKSALGKYPREETVDVLQDSDVIAFSVGEFEQFVLKNTRIIMKMLRVFSNQLRRIHKQVNHLLSSGEQTVDLEKGLISIGQYYFKQKKYRQALYAYKRYLINYPAGTYTDEAKQNMRMVEQHVQGHDPAPAFPAFQKQSPPLNSTPQLSASRGNELSDVAKQYYNAISLYSQQNYGEALKEFKTILSQGADAEFSAKSLFEIGKCLYSLREYDQCIKHYIAMIQKYPKHPDLLEALFYVGSCNESLGDQGKAASFYKKILTMAAEEVPVHRKAKKALKKLEGN